MLNDKTYFLVNNPKLYMETLKEFSTNPYGLASLNAIIKNSDFNKGSFYYRFIDKFDLYTALFSELVAKQYDFIEILKSFTVNNGLLQSYLTTLFESQLELFNENPLYLSLIDKFSKEPIQFKTEVIAITGAPILDVFSENIVFFLKNDYALNSSQISIFLNLIKLSYNQLISILDNDINKNTISNLVDNLMKGIYQDPPSIRNQVVISGKNLYYQYSKSNNGIYKFDFSLNKCEILAIVGPKSSGKTTISNVLVGKLKRNEDSFIYYSFTEDDINSKEIQSYFDAIINYNKSLTWNLSNIAAKFSIHFQNESILDDFRIERNTKTKIRSLEPIKRKVIEIYIKSFLNRDLIIIDDLFVDLNQPEIVLLSNFLLKCRHQGSTIILTSHHIYNVINIADKIAFLSEGHLIKIKTVDELHQKYGKITHIVKYVDGNNTKIAAFSNDNFNSEFFKSIIDQYKLLSLETKTTLPDEIFKLETGVNL